MKPVMKFLGWAVLASAVVGIALVVAALALAASLDPLTIHVDGAPLDIDSLATGEWLFAIGGIALALLVVALVVPLAVLLPLALVALALLGVLLALAGAVALAFSPLILLGLAVWLVLRLIRRDAAKDGERGATIAR